ncbi:MAG: hypothetical protein KC766_17220 [Myxococcales bacterium]|nr:hypothetical protein [Myxococcales bacterium]
MISRFCFAFLALSLSGCAAKTLDGGVSDASVDGAADDAPLGDGGASASQSSGPVRGTIDGSEFVLGAADVQFQRDAQFGDQYFLTLRNYKSTCGDLPGGPPDEKSAMLVNVGNVPPRAGSFTLAYADGHGAALQHGLYNDSSKSTLISITKGTVTLDSWSTTAGDKITGTISVEGEDGSSKVQGSFSAEVCAGK